MGCICGHRKTRWLRTHAVADGDVGEAAVYLDFEGRRMVLGCEVHGAREDGRGAAAAPMRHCPLCGRELGGAGE